MSQISDDIDDVNHVRVQLESPGLGLEMPHQSRTAQRVGRNDNERGSEAHVPRTLPDLTPISTASFSHFTSNVGSLSNYEIVSMVPQRLRGHSTREHTLLPGQQSSADDLTTLASLNWNMSTGRRDLNRDLGDILGREDQLSADQDAARTSRIENLGAELANRIAQRWLRAHPSGQETSQRRSTNQTSEAAGYQVATFHLPSQQKRGRPRRSNLNNAGDDSEEEKDRPSLSRQRKRARQSTGKVFACPYAKFDPERYSMSNENEHEERYKNCSAVRLTDMRCVKQHLTRVHKKPDWYCGRCYEEFKSQAFFDDHQRLLPSCELRNEKFQEKIDNDQVKKLKRPGQDASEHEYWMHIYKVLFPSATSRVTPYVLDPRVEHILPIFRFFGPEELHGMMRRREIDLRIEAPEVICQAFRLLLGPNHEIMREQSVAEHTDTARPTTSHSTAMSTTSEELSTSPMSVLSNSDGSQIISPSRSLANQKHARQRDDYLPAFQAQERLHIPYTSSGVRTEDNHTSFDSSTAHEIKFTFSEATAYQSPGSRCDVAQSISSADDTITCCSEEQRIFEEWLNDEYL